MSRRKREGQTGLALLGYVVLLAGIAFALVSFGLWSGLLKTKTTIDLRLEPDDRGSSLAALAKAESDGKPVLEVLGNLAAGLAEEETLSERLATAWGAGSYYRLAAAAAVLTNGGTPPEGAGAFTMPVPLPGGGRAVMGLQVWS